MTLSDMVSLIPQEAVKKYEEGLRAGRYAEDCFFIGAALQSPDISLEERAALFVNFTERLIPERVLQKQLDPDVISAAHNEIMYPALMKIISNEAALRAYGKLMLNSPYTGIHSLDTGIIASCLVAYCDLHHDEQVDTVVAGIMHDIGKLKIHPNILEKPGALTDEEYGLVKDHSGDGYDYVRVIFPDSETVQVSVRGHHERYDGSGYPDRLIGDEISCSARVLGIADSFDAATSPRPYREEGLPVSVIVRELYENVGEKYDPHIVGVFPLLFTTNIQDRIGYKK